MILMDSDLPHKIEVDENSDQNIQVRYIPLQRLFLAPHINYITEKAWFRITVMRKLKFKLDRKSLETIYKAFIRPLLEYGNNIWDNCTQSEKDELEKIQNEAARIATGATKLVSINILYKEIC